MSAKHLTPDQIDRTIYVIDQSGIVDMIYPPRNLKKVGRRGAPRQNMRLLLIALHLCTRLGQETTVRGAHQVLLEALSRDMQWELGVYRKAVTKSQVAAAPIGIMGLVNSGRSLFRKRRWTVGTGADAQVVEEIGYYDLWQAAKRLRSNLDYGEKSAKGLTPEERMRRRVITQKIVEALILTTSIPPLTTTYAIDATGQWAWTRGHKPPASMLCDKDEVDDGPLESAPIAMDVDGSPTPLPEDEPKPMLENTNGRCQDAQWGYKTSKNGVKERGFGFHQHTIVRVPAPNHPNNSEPLLVDGFAITPANADVVAASLEVVDGIRSRNGYGMTCLVGDALYTNLTGDRWAVPLARRGIEQGLTMRAVDNGVVDISGAKMQHGWLHCPAAPMKDRPLPPQLASDGDQGKLWGEYAPLVANFQRNWAFDRKESGLGKQPTSKWICPARAGRAACHALGGLQVAAAGELGLPIITPPSDWKTRPCCTQKTIDFTPNPANVHEHRKLMQRYYYGSESWRQLYRRRTFVEGVFGILKNSSRQRLRRGQNRLPGLASATVIAAIKISVFNEEQLRAWYEATGDVRGKGHALVAPDHEYAGFVHLTKGAAAGIDAQWLQKLENPTGTDGEAA